MSGSALQPPAGCSRVPVQRGDRVEAGALLFALEDGRQRAAVAEAEAQLARARSQLADLKLGKRPEEIARLEANLAEAKAALTYAEQDLDRQARLARRDFAAEARLDQARSAAEARRGRGSRPWRPISPPPGCRRATTRSRRRGRGGDARGAALAQAQLGARPADGARAHGRHGRGPRPRQRASGSMPAASSSACCRPARSRSASSCPSRSWAGSGSARRSICAATAALPA